MRVILSIDALHLPLTGIGWYTLELAQGLRERPEVESLLFTNGRRFPVPLPNFGSNFGPDMGADAEYGVESGVDAQPMLAAPEKPRVLQPLYRVAGRVLSLRCQAKLETLPGSICHGPNYIVPRRSPRARNIATIHDLSIFRYPELHPKHRVSYMRKRIPQTIANCERLIVSSQAVAHEVGEMFSVAEDRISVVPLGVRKVFGQQSQPLDQGFLRKAGLEGERFLLFVNGADPRKNLSATLAAFELYTQSKCDGLKLVVTMPSAADTELSRQLASLPGVVPVFYPADVELAALYRNAAGLLFPSRYEGFGLPVVEALAAGTPVLISRAETLLEFAELPGVVALDIRDSGDSKEVEGFSDAIAQLLSVQLGEAASSGANAIAERFGWSNCVSGTLASYSALS